MKHNDNNIRMKGKEKASMLSPFSFLISKGFLLSPFSFLISKGFLLSAFSFSFLVRKKNSFHKKPTATQ